MQPSRLTRSARRLTLHLPRRWPWEEQFSRALARWTTRIGLGEQACRAGEPSGQGEEPSPEGLGGHDLLTQADAGCPAGQVVRHHLYRQPGGVGGEAARGEMVQPDAVLEVAYRILDLGVAAVAGVVASIRCSFSGVGFLFQNPYPRSTGAPSYRFRTLTRRPPSVNSG